jgi:DNA-binding MarR family transcriptional regulator
MTKIAPHEPDESLLSDPEEAFRDAELSEARWQAWESQQQLQPVLVELSPAEYRLLASLAQRQGKTVPQLAEALLQSILSALSPSLQTSN